MNDCFAFKPRSCTALTVKKCEGCSFYKTRNQFQEGHREAMVRIQSLDRLHQQEIFEKYYRTHGR